MFDDKHSIKLTDICKYTSSVHEFWKIVASFVFQVESVVDDAS